MYFFYSSIQDTAQPIESETITGPILQVCASLCACTLQLQWEQDQHKLRCTYLWYFIIILIKEFEHFLIESGPSQFKLFNNNLKKFDLVKFLFMSL